MQTPPRKPASFLLLAVVALSATSGVEGSNGWTTGGPQGNSFASILTARSKVLFVASARGIYRSPDWGNRWDLSLASAGSGGWFTSLTIDPSDPSVIFATMNSLDGRALFKSTDGGKSWRAITAGMKIPNGVYDGTISDIRSLAIDPRDSKVMYAGTARGRFGLGYGLILRSTDGGESWEPASSEFRTGAVMDLKIDPEDRRTLYAVTYRGESFLRSGLFKSTDGGRDWTEIGGGLPRESFERSPPPPIRAVVIDPREPSTLYAATTEEGIYRSHDRGATWQPVNEGLPRLEGLTIYPIVRALAWDQDGALYAGLDPYGLFRSVDGGDHWTGLNFGSPITGVSAGAGARSLLYVVGPRGLYRSADGGGSWKDAGDGLDSGASIWTLATDPATPGAVYAGTVSVLTAWDPDPGDGRWRPPDRSNPGVFRSLDRGRTWARTSPAGEIHALAVDARTGWIYASISGRLFRSQDHALTWQDLHWDLSQGIRAIAIDSGRSILYVGTDNQGVYKSTDDGNSWSTLNNGLMADGWQVVSCLAIDPTDTSVIYAATFGRGVYKTFDGGATWTKVNTGLTYRETCAGCSPQAWDLTIHRIAIDPSHPRTLYAGAVDWGVPGTGGVFRSDDGGMTWTMAGDGLLTVGSRRVWDLVVDPRDGGSIYIATDDGVFRSRGEAISWQAMNEGIPDLRARSVALDPHPPGALHAATDAGVFTLGPMPESKTATVERTAKDGQP